MADGILIPCNVACGSGIVTVNSPSGSALQCDTWLWDDMPLNSPKRSVSTSKQRKAQKAQLLRVFKNFVKSLKVVQGHSKLHR